ncbi:MAG TPA: hypothetical protein VEO00_05725 [Actinomycetota bacterium]|nr:hypothetical protein [Actinomycetota bacterium]
MKESPATRGQMFGMPVLKIGTKVFTGVWGDAMNFKLGEKERAAALKLDGAEQFDPGMGRPMKEWVLVPASHAARWTRLAKQALAYVWAGSTPPTSATRRT